MPLGEGDGCGAGGGEIAAAVEKVEVGAQSGFAANVKVNVKVNAVDSDWKNENLKSVDGKAPVADDSCYRAGQT